MAEEVCPEEFEDWQEAYKEWETAGKTADEAAQDYLRLQLVASAVCTAAAFANPVALVGCAAAVAAAIDAADDAIRARDEEIRLSEESNTKGDAYKQCVEDHKKQQPVVTPLPIVTPL
jgi:hypothetical protein